MPMGGAWRLIIRCPYRSNQYRIGLVIAIMASGIFAAVYPQGMIHLPPRLGVVAVDKECRRA